PRCSSSIATSQHYTGGTGKLFGKEKRKNGNCIIWKMIFLKRQTWPNPNPKSRPSSALPLTKNKRKSSIIWRSKKNFKESRSLFYKAGNLDVSRSFLPPGRRFFRRSSVLRLKAVLGTQAGRLVPSIRA